MKIHGRTERDRRDKPDAIIPYLVNNILICYERETYDSERKQHFQQHKEKHSNNKKSYINRSKSTERKVGFLAVFTSITRRGALPEEVKDTKKRA